MQRLGRLLDQGQIQLGCRIAALGRRRKSAMARTA
jgi:hypothetical protein